MKKKHFLPALLLAALSAGKANANVYEVTDFTDQNPSVSGTLRFAIDNLPSGNHTILIKNITAQEIPLVFSPYTPLLLKGDDLITFQPGTGPVTLVAQDISGSSLMTIADTAPHIVIPAGFNLDAQGDAYVTALKGDADIKFDGDLGGDISAFSNQGDGAYGIYTSNTPEEGPALLSKSDISIGNDLSGSVSATATGSKAIGMYAGTDVTIDEEVKTIGDISIGNDLSGTVSAEAGDFNAFGMFAGNDLTINRNFTATGSVSAISASNDAQAMVASAGNLAIAGFFAGTVSAAATTGFSAYAMTAGTDLTIGGDFTADGSISATAGGFQAQAMQSQAGILSIGGDFAGDVIAEAAAGYVAYGMFAGTELKIGGDFTADGSVSAKAGSYDAKGMYAGGDLGIGRDFAGVVSAETGTGGYAWGMYAGNNLTIGGNFTGNGLVSAKAGTDDAKGMYAENILSIGGDFKGDVSAETGTGKYAWGIYAGNNLSIVGDFTADASVTATAGIDDARGMTAAMGYLSIGGELAGDVSATAGGHTAAGMYAYNIYGADSETPLLISGTVSATAEGAAAGILAQGSMNIDITGTVSGTDTGGDDRGYAIHSGDFDFDGDFASSIEVSDLVTVEEYGRLVGRVDLGAGDDLFTLKDHADISEVPALDGGDDNDGPVEDQLVFNGWTGSLGGVDVVNWETIELNNGSRVNLGASELEVEPETIAFTTLTIDPTSTLLAAGSSPGFYKLIGDDLFNNGTISLLDNQDTGDRLEIGADYTGYNGVIKFDVNSDTEEADLLAINDTAGGTTGLDLNELGVPKSPVTPILLIRVEDDSESDPDTFTAGEYIYPWGPKLYNFTLTSESDGEDGIDYYYSSLAFDRYREEAALLQGVTPFVERLGFESLTGFHERNAYNHLACGESESPVFWARAYGSSFGIGQEGDAATTLKGYSGGTQVGADLAAGPVGKSTQYHFGPFAGIGWQSADVGGIVTTRAGELSQRVYNMGLYASIDCPEGYYVEAVGQAGYHHIDINSTDEPGTIKTNTWSLAASLEGGFTIPVSNTFRLEPQAQIIYQHTGDMQLTTVMGDATVESHDGLRTRLGLTGTFGKPGASFNPFFEVNLIKDFTDDSRVSYASGGSLLKSNPETAQLGGAIGISRKVSKTNDLSYYLKAEALYGIEGLSSYDYKLTAGIRKSW